MLAHELENLPPVPNGEPIDDVCENRVSLPDGIGHEFALHVVRVCVQKKTIVSFASSIHDEFQRHMPTFYMRGQKHTMASAVRELLEEAHPDEFVSCSVVHPEDDHIVVEAPSEAALRRCLLALKDKIAIARRSIAK